MVTVACVGIKVVDVAVVVLAVGGEMKVVLSTCCAPPSPAPEETELGTPSV